MDGQSVQSCPIFPRRPAAFVTPPESTDFVDECYVFVQGVYGMACATASPLFT